MFKIIIKYLLPKLFIQKINFLLKRDIKIYGSFNNWNEAVLNSGSYKSKTIFLKTKSSFLKVLNGEASYERDSVTFHKEKLNRPLILLLEKIRKKNKNNFLKVMDFGGSFGSTYFQNKKVLHDCSKYQWDIVEQEKIVDFANASIQAKNLYFYKSLADYTKTNKPDAVLFSSVLHYLEFPFKTIEKLLYKKIKYFIILKTPFFKNKSEIKVQINPRHIYAANYPIKIFNEILFKSFFANYKYKIQKLNWDKQLIDGINFKSFLFKKITLNKNNAKNNKNS